MENGRAKILCDIIPTGDIATDKVLIPKILDITLSQHQKNVPDMQRLLDYYYNKTDIRFKQKTQQKAINNKVVIDYPQIAVTTINAYCFANPLSFSSRDPAKDDEMGAFLDALDDDSYSQKSMKMYFNAGLTALGYRYITPATEEQQAEGIYFQTTCDLDPLKTYCVYANDLKQDKICAVSFYDKRLYDPKTLQQNGTVRIYNVWTKYHQWAFYRSGNEWVNSPYSTYDADGNEVQFEAYPLPYKKIPVIENLRKIDRTSDYELALDLINAINNLASSRVDDVQQAVDYIILLRDIDTDTQDAIDHIKQAIKEGILSFKSVEGATVQPDISVLDTKINQAEVQTLQEFLCSKLEEVLNIPNRETRTSGGDTGVAVESRNGFRSLENIAGMVTSQAKKTENETLEVIFAICKNIPSCPFKDLRVRDIEVKENRNRVENMSNASLAYSQLRAAGMNDYDSLVVTNIVPDALATKQRNKEALETESANSSVGVDTATTNGLSSDTNAE